MTTNLEPTIGLSALRGAATNVADVPCHSSNPELWFAESPTDIDHAKALCHSCPFQVACLDGALARREPWGVWGGQLFVQGAVIAHKRPRGRPRKSQAA